MRKLTILQSLVNFIWYITCIPLIPLLLFMVVCAFYDPSIVQFTFDVSNEQVAENSALIPLFVVMIAILGYISIYSFYLFRKSLRFFQQRKPFHEEVISIYKTIGKTLTFFGIGLAVLSFIIRIVFTSEIKLSLGVSPYIMLVCLGLFFMVLSEIFLVAKVAKEENELTV